MAQIPTVHVSKTGKEWANEMIDTLETHFGISANQPFDDKHQEATIYLKMYLEIYYNSSVKLFWEK